MTFKLKSGNKPPFKNMGSSPMKDDHNEAAWQAQVDANFGQLSAAEQLAWANEHRKTYAGKRKSGLSAKDRTKNIMRYKKVYINDAAAGWLNEVGTIWDEDESNFYSDAFKEKLAGTISEDE